MAHVVADAKEVFRSLKAGDARRVRLCYLGRSYATLHRLRQSAPGTAVHGGGEDLIRISTAIARGMIDLDALAMGRASRLAWDASDLGERRAIAGQIQRFLASVLVMLAELETGAQTLFVCDERAEAFVYRDCAVLAGHELLVSPAPRPGERLFGEARALVSGLRSRLAVARATLRARSTVKRLRQTIGRAAPSPRDADCLVFGWATTSTFQSRSDGHLEMAYLGALPEVIAKTGLKPLYLCADPGSDTPYATVAENAISGSHDAMMTEECLSIGQIVAAFLASLRGLAGLSSDFRLLGKDLTPALRHLARLDRASGRMMQAMLRHAQAAMLARMGAKPKVAVFIFENQPWDKLLRHGLRAHFPSMTQIASVVVQFSQNHLSFLPSRRDLASGPGPDLFLTALPVAAEGLASAGVPASAIRIGGGPRHGAAKSWADPRPPKPPGRTHRVLLSGNAWPDQTLELAVKGVMAARGLPCVEVVMNFHPLMGEIERTGILAEARALAESSGVRFDHAPSAAEQLLDQADLLIYGPTSVCFAALERGIPIVHLVSETDVDYDKVPYDVPIPRPMTAEQLHGVLRSWVAGETDLQLDAETRRALAARMFAPLDEDVWREALLAVPRQDPLREDPI